MTSRLLGAVSAPSATPADVYTLRIWGSTSGGATPSLDSPSYGASSITDTGTGLVDIAFERAFGSATSYACALAARDSQGFATSVTLMTTITSTAVRMRADNGAGNAVDPTGFHFVVIGV